MRSIAIAIIAMSICIAVALVALLYPNTIRTLLTRATHQKLHTVYSTSSMQGIDMSARGASIKIVARGAPPYRIEASSGCSVSVEGTKSIEIVAEGSSGCRILIEVPPKLSYLTLYVRKGSVEIDGVSVGTLAATLISSSTSLNGVVVRQSLYLYLFTSTMSLNGVEMARGSSGSIKMFSSSMSAVFSSGVKPLLDTYMSRVSNKGCVSGPEIRILARMSSLSLSCP